MAERSVLGLRAKNSRCLWLRWGDATKASCCYYWAHILWSPGTATREKPAYYKEDAAQPKLIGKCPVSKADAKNPTKHRFVNAPIRALGVPSSPRMQLISVTSSSHTTSSWRNPSLSCSHSLKTKLTFLQTKISNLNIFFWKLLLRSIISAAFWFPAFLYSLIKRLKTLMIWMNSTVLAPKQGCLPLRTPHHIGLALQRHIQTSDSEILTQ